MPLSRDIDTVGLDAILKTALDAVIVMRYDGTIAGWNDVAARTLGWSFQEALGRRMSDLIIPQRFREAHERGLAHFIASGEAPVLDGRLELDAIRRDGYEIPIELSITRTSSAGEPVFLGFLRDISERRAAERRQALMIGELNHRVKNLLGVVAGIAHQTIRASRTLEDFEAAFGGRLQSLGRAHEILTDATWERASLRELADALLATFCAPLDGRAQVSGPDLTLSPRQFLTLSMIMHELTTNAVKYGALSTIDGSVELSWTVDGDRIELHWREHSTKAISAPSHAGFGSKMIALSVKHELRGEATSDWTPQGLAFTLHFEKD